MNFALRFGIALGAVVMGLTWVIAEIPAPGWLLAVGIVGLVLLWAATVSLFIRGGA